MPAISEKKRTRRRNLIGVQTYTDGSGDGQAYGCRSTLPMSAATATESENAGARIMDAVNAQLDYAGSDLRLVLYDVKKKEYVKVSYSK
jgi:hypothetical protein